MLQSTPVGARAVCTRKSSAQICKVPEAITRRPVGVRASASSDNNSDDAFKPSRRTMLVAVPAAATLILTGPPAFAESYQQFLGYNQAPDLYLGYGAARDSPAQYSFEYPADWEEAVVTKTDKSTMGMDGMVKHPSTRKEQAYVIALGGKDYRDSVLKDAKTSLTVIAGGDPDLRQAVTDGEVKQVSKTINGTPMYMYEITSDKRNYLSTIGKKGDTVFALVVTAPHAAFDKDGQALRHIQDTFKLL